MNKCSKCEKIVNDNVLECPKCGGFILTKKHGGNGIKKKLNKAIWKLYFKGYNQTETSQILYVNRRTVYAHLFEYGRLKI